MNVIGCKTTANLDWLISRCRLSCLRVQYEWGCDDPRGAGVVSGTGGWRWLHASLQTTPHIITPRPIAAWSWRGGQYNTPIPGSPEPQHTHQFSKDCSAVPWHTCQSDGMVNINLAPTSNASMSSTSRWSSPQRPRKATSALNNRKELLLRNHSQSRWKNWTAYVWILLTDIGCDRPFIYKWWIY